MTEGAPKFKFKKRNNASLKKKQLRRSSGASEDNNGKSVSGGGGVGSVGSSGGGDVVVKAEVDDHVDVIGEDAVKVEDHDDANPSDHNNNSNSKVKKEQQVEDSKNNNDVGGLGDDNNNYYNNNDKDYDDDDEEPSTLNTILAVERRKKILGTGRLASRGMDVTSLLKGGGETSSLLLKRNTIKKINSMKHKGSGTDNDEYEESLNSKIITSGNKDLEERLKGTFAGGKLAGSNDMGGDEDGGILAKKHKRAMEEFIQKNLGGGGGASASNSFTSGNGSGNAGNIGEGGTVGDDGVVGGGISGFEKEMYSDILLEASSNNAPAPAEESGDVGAGGAMMGGTGIAEVALPIDERIKALKETEKAAREYERARRARFGGGLGMEMEVGGDAIFGDGSHFEDSSSKNANPSSAISPTMVPMSFASGPGKRKRYDTTSSTSSSLPSQPSSLIISSQQQPRIHPSTPDQESTSYPIHSSALTRSSASSAGAQVHSTDVSTLGASYSHNFQLHTKEWISKKRDERQYEIDAISHQRQLEDMGTTEENRARVGFDVARKMAKGEVVIGDASGGSGGGNAGHSGGGGGPSMRNEWDRKQGGDQRSNDDRVWKTFMSKQKNRR